MEKAHGTSAKVGWKDGQVWFFSGGAKHETFTALFEADVIAQKFRDIGHGDDCPITVYGEAYGGKMQGMRDTYGQDLRFVAFEVKVDGTWLSVPNAEDVAKKVGLDFVPWELVECTLENLDAQRDRESVIAIRNGVGPGHKREGIVIRPVWELRLSNGDRLMAKHKADDFRESRTRQPKPGGQAKQAAMKVAGEYVHEYIVLERLKHVIDALGGDPGIQDTGKVIQAMIGDVFAEELPPEGMDIKVITKGMGKATAMLFKKYLQDKLGGSND
jgi:hypothetical protein